MPVYRLALCAIGTAADTTPPACLQRRFYLYVTAANPAEARAGLSGTLTDPRDGQYVDQWRLISTRRVAELPDPWPYEQGLAAGRERAQQLQAAGVPRPPAEPDPEPGAGFTSRDRTAWLLGWRRGMGSTPAGRYALPGPHNPPRPLDADASP